MKCQNCGKDEINFHYSSNVNGCVTETHLCSECAAKSGYDFEHMFDVQSLIEGFSPFNMRAGFLPMPMFGFGIADMLSPWSLMGLRSKECGCDGACETLPKQSSETELDGNMQKRREINVMREQMRLAAQEEDFEKAAQLRDEIKRMEAE